MEPINNTTYDRSAWTHNEYDYNHEAASYGAGGYNNGNACANRPPFSPMQTSFVPVQPVTYSPRSMPQRAEGVQAMYPFPSNGYIHPPPRPPPPPPPVPSYLSHQQLHKKNSNTNYNGMNGIQTQCDGSTSSSTSTTSHSHSLSPSQAQQLPMYPPPVPPVPQVQMTNMIKMNQMMKEMKSNMDQMMVMTNLNHLKYMKCMMEQSTADGPPSSVVQTPVLPSDSSAP
eukprot:242426_1